MPGYGNPALADLESFGRIKRMTEEQDQMASHSSGKMQPDERSLCLEQLLYLGQRTAL